MNKKIKKQVPEINLLSLELFELLLHHMEFHKAVKATKLAMVVLTKVKEEEQ